MSTKQDFLVFIPLFLIHFGFAVITIFSKMNGPINLDLLEWLEHEIQRDELNQQRRFLRENTDPFVIPDDIFIRYYRLSKNLTREFIEILRPHIDEGLRRTKISVELKVLTLLYFLAHGSYQKCVGINSNISMEQSTISKFLAETTDAIANIMHNYIRFPQTPAERNLIKNQFYEKFNFPGVIGAIDCTHVGIIAPDSNNPERPPAVYFNRKGYFSLNVEMICDSNLTVTYCNARFPGSCHDSAIWSLSPVREMLLNEHLNGETNSWLIGDAGYPLEPWLLTPEDYIDVDIPEGRYTTTHIRSRNCIERCFGLLKQRFRCLLKHRILHYDHSRAAKIIYACVVLHNLCLLHDIPLPNDADPYHLPPIDIEIPENVLRDVPENRNPWRREGLRVIHRLKNTHFLNNVL